MCSYESFSSITCKLVSYFAIDGPYRFDKSYFLTLDDSGHFPTPKTHRPYDLSIKAHVVKSWLYLFVKLKKKRIYNTRSAPRLWFQLVCKLNQIKYKNYMYSICSHLASNLHITPTIIQFGWIPKRIQCPTLLRHYLCLNPWILHNFHRHNYIWSCTCKKYEFPSLFYCTNVLIVHKVSKSSCPWCRDEN